MLFKVTDKEGRPCSGGSGIWPLPQNGQPGAWWQITGELRICENALHGDTNPLNWRGDRLWEFDPDAALGIQIEGTKAGFKRARLVREITLDWPLIRLYPLALVWLSLKTDKQLSGADLYGADLYGADLSRADLSRTNLSRTNLSRANLSRANLSRANLYGANLSGANLYGADLYGANLSGADLYGADLYGANFSGAYRPTDCPNGYLANANGYLVKGN